MGPSTLNVASASEVQCPLISQAQVWFEGQMEFSASFLHALGSPQTDALYEIDRSSQSYCLYNHRSACLKLLKRELHRCFFESHCLDHIASAQKGGLLQSSRCHEYANACRAIDFMSEKARKSTSNASTSIEYVSALRGIQQYFCPYRMASAVISATD